MNGATTEKTSSVSSSLRTKLPSKSTYEVSAVLRLCRKQVMTPQGTALGGSEPPSLKNSPTANNLRAALFSFVTTPARVLFAQIVTTVHYLSHLALWERRAGGGGAQREMNSCAFSSYF